MPESAPQPQDRPPSVAVVIPCWNAEAFVARAVQSALEQNYRPFEVIAVDDGSTDASVAILQSFGAQITSLPRPHQGACAARNAGLEAATSDYLCFLDADDYLEPGHVQEMIAALGKSADMVIAKRHVYEARGRQRARMLPFAPTDQPADFIRHWLSGNNAQTASILWRRNFLTRIGGWNAAMLRLQDIEIALRAFRAAPEIAICPGGRAVYVDHTGSQRVSRRHSEQVLAADERYLAGLERELAAYPAAVIYALGLRSYSLAGVAYHYGVDDIGDAHLRRARSCGVTGHVGTPAHRLLATLVGYRRKVMLAAKLRRAFTILASSISPSNAGSGRPPAARPPRDREARS